MVLNSSDKNRERSQIGRELNDGGLETVFPTSSAVLRQVRHLLILSVPTPILNFDRFLTSVSDYHSMESLSKTGKPLDNEWTSLAAIIEVKEPIDCTKSDLKSFRVVSLATGTKCVTGKAANVDPNVIIDCHAESLCRRAFKRYRIECIKNGHWPERRTKYYMLISQLPCGIVDRYEGESEECVFKKPGRGERCLKPSCIFKISKWIKNGLQGRSLVDVHNCCNVPKSSGSDETVGRIDLSGLIIGNCTQEVEVTENVLTKINSVIEECQSHLDTVKIPQNGNQATNTDERPSPKRMKSDLKRIPIHFDSSFKCDTFTKCDSKRACFTSIVSWLSEDVKVSKMENVSEVESPKVSKVTEIIVQGRRQGSTGKNSKNNQLLVSSLSLKEDIEGLNKNCEKTKTMKLKWNNFPSSTYLKCSRLIFLDPLFINYFH